MDRETEAEREIVRIYQRSVQADILFGQLDYIGAANTYLNSLIALQEVLRRDPGCAHYWMVVAPDELRNARHFLGASYGPLERNGITAGVYRELMTAMVTEAFQIAGCEAPACPISLTVPPDEDIIEQAFADMVNVSLPVPDGQWDTSIGKLELAALKIEAVLQRCPDLQNESVARLSWRDGTGAQALSEVRQKLADARREARAAAERLQSTPPDEVLSEIALVLDQIARMIDLTQQGEFLNTLDAELFVAGRAEYLTNMWERWRTRFAQENRSMPDDLQQPIIAQLDALQTAIDTQASHNAFPSDSAHDPVLEASVRAQLAHTVPAAQILQTAMSDTAWQITTNEWNVPLYRRKYGWVLYQLPNERWARLYHVLFQEAYAGEGTYETGDGASRFGLMRWQQT